VPAEAVRLALRALSCRFSAAIASHSAAILVSVAQSQEGWSRILAAWRAETADGRGDAKAAVAADAGALCEQLLVLVCSQFGRHATTGAGVPGRGCHDVDTADQGGETCRADAIVGSDEAAASAGVTVSSWAELTAAEAAHQLESALTSCVQIAGFLGCAASTGSPGAATSERLGGACGPTDLTGLSAVAMGGGSTCSYAATSTPVAQALRRRTGDRITANSEPSAPAVTSTTRWTKPTTPGGLAAAAACQAKRETGETVPGPAAGCNGTGGGDLPGGHRSLRRRDDARRVR